MIVLASSLLHPDAFKVSYATNKFVLVTMLKLHNYAEHYHSS